MISLAATGGTFSSRFSIPFGAYFAQAMQVPVMG
jgi:hypothetical protein